MATLAATTCFAAKGPPSGQGVSSQRKAPILQNSASHFASVAKSYADQCAEHSSTSSAGSFSPASVETKGKKNRTFKTTAHQRKWQQRNLPASASGDRPKLWSKPSSVQESCWKNIAVASSTEIQLLQGFSQATSCNLQAHYSYSVAGFVGDAGSFRGCQSRSSVCFL